MHRRTFLTLGGTSAGTMCLLAGCSVADRPRQTPTDTQGYLPEPTHSYEAITGTWTASTYPEDSTDFEHSHAKLEIVTESATPGEEVGTLTLFVEKGGEVHCGSTLTAYDADPPTAFWVNVDADSGDYPCFTHLRYRFEPVAPNRLEWYITYNGGFDRQVPDLSRPTGREAAMPTTREGNDQTCD